MVPWRWLPGLSRQACGAAAAPTCQVPGQVVSSATSRVLPAVPAVIPQLPAVGSRAFSAAADSVAQVPSFRTPVTSPARHTVQDDGLFYTMPAEEQTRLFQVTGLRRSLANQARTFGELSLMVRQPALDILHCLRASDMSRPVARYLLYGRHGTGKTTSVLHVLHYALQEGWLVLHLPEVDRWGLRFREVSPSTTDPQLIDLPIDSAFWLTHFRSQNGQQLAQLGLTTQRQYTWSRRESTPQGAPLTELVEHGVGRAKHASACVCALLEELRLHAAAGRCRLLLAVERVNALWTLSAVRREDRTPVPFSELSVMRGVLNLLTAPWQNGAVVCTAAPVRSSDTVSHLPRTLLGPDGWRALDPFVPVRVDDLTRRQADNYVDYCIDRRWLRPAAGSEAARQELFFRSGGNAGKLAELCRTY